MKQYSNYIMKHNITFFLFMVTISVQAQMHTDTFRFSFEGRKYVGLIDVPENQQAKAMVVIVPGSGKTNIVAGNWFHSMRACFTSQGIACLVWDKRGCGKSEGIFDGDPPVQNSANEVIAAIAEARAQHLPGSDKIGLWGISRAGWICPLVIEQTPIAFWISVSGTDDKETFGYLLERNFLIEGRSKKETAMLMKEWHANMDIARHGGTFEENQEATKHLRNDSFYIFITNGSKPTAEGYARWQRGFQTGENMPVDEKTGLPIYLLGFDTLLRKINCPVLAIFGEKDSQVDWRRTMALYKRTIGKNPKATLTIKTFPDGNHGITKCKTGGYREKLEKREVCDGYYATMMKWLASCFDRLNTR